MYKIIIRLKRYLKRYLKIQAETRQVQTSRASSKVYRYLMLLVAVSLIAFMYPAENLFGPLDWPQKGEIARKDIIATSQITILKSDDTIDDERQAAINAIPTILDYKNINVDSIMSKFERFINQSVQKREILRRKGGEIVDNLSEFEQLKDSLRQSIYNQFPFMTLTAVDSALSIDSLEKASEVIRKILNDDIYFVGVLSDTSLLPDIKNNSVIIRIGKREVFVTRSKLQDLSQAYQNFLSSLNAMSVLDSFNIEAYYEIGRHFITANLRINNDELKARQDSVASQITLVKEEVDIGDVVVRAGQKITDRQSAILKEMFKQQRVSADDEYQYRQYFPVMARFVLILGVMALLYLFLHFFHKKIFISNPKILTLLLIYGIELVFIYFIGVKQGLPIYLYPIPIFAILITVLFDAKIAIFNTIILALILGILHRFNFPLVLTTAVIGMVAAFTVQKVSHRTEFFKAILLTGIAYLVLILSLESFNLGSSENITSYVGYGFLNAVFSPLLAMGFLPIFESIFGFTTNITLLELSDMNNPLLKRLSIEAPGTYHHSLLVGNLAEYACKSINANSLLARVGAYYHDIGKMEIPEYFVENQLGIKSKHDALTPSMSSIILSSHIKKGRFIGEQADLPDEVLNFIEEHHGTMTMSYFLNKAKEMGEENPSEDEFRYPGPKPQIRETAVVMLADSVEAASRTLNDPKPARIRNLVQSIINDRYQSGELEECPLTLKDLAGIRESFIKILTGVFHHRIEYPDKTDEK